MPTMATSSELMSRLQAALGPLYRLERELGHGGMGVVFLARDVTLDRAVAVKVVHPELAAHTAITERFLAEARMIARLRHPGIIAVHTAGEATGLFYYVMDYVPGESLRERLQREGRLSPGIVRRIVADVADALHAAGQAGLVHRDVKPENILLDRDTGRAMIADFGIARVVAGGVNGPETGRGLAVGTPTYMSPEQAAGEVVDPRCDLYALGVVAYEMLAGRPPFRAHSATAVATMHLAEQPTPLEQARPGTPPALAHAITRALEKDPANRWQTGAEFRDAALAERLSPAADRSSRSRHLALAGAALIVIFAGAFALLRPDGPPHGIDPRHSILILPFENLRRESSIDWIRDGSVSMLALTMAQWNDLTIVDQGRLHDLLERREIPADQPIGLATARRLARDAGVWTVLLGEYEGAGDSLHLVARVYDVATGNRVDLAQVSGAPGEDVRPLFDQLAARLLDLSGAPAGLNASLARVTTASLEAYQTYLAGAQELTAWRLTEADRRFRRAVALDSTFALAHYRLALTRGWISGADDSVGHAAIQRATRFADRLPPRDRAMVEAYRLFLDQNFDGARAAYHALLTADSTDADAWYGLGDLNFHDPDKTHLGEHHTESLRAFKRAIALDPGYYLAYEHLEAIYRLASLDQPALALLPGDSLVRPEAPPLTAADSLKIVQAVRLARDQGLAVARVWSAHQPDNAQAQNAVIRALEAAEEYPAALTEIDRLAASAPGGVRTDLPFLRAQIQTQLGDPREAAQMIARAMDSASPVAFQRSRLPIETVNEVLHGANLLAYTGRVDAAERALDLASRISAEWMPEAPGSGTAGERSLVGQLFESHLYTALGAPAVTLQPIWDAIADRARRAPKAEREAVASFGWAAALGLFLRNTADLTPLNELQALGGGNAPNELRALTAMARGETAQARSLLLEPESTTAHKLYDRRPQWIGYRQMIIAELWQRLGEPDRALSALEGFDPSRLSTNGLDVRWFLMGQARVLRGEIYESQGKSDLAREQYRLVLAQWEQADSVVQPLVARVRTRLGRLDSAG